MLGLEGREERSGYGCFDEGKVRATAEPKKRELEICEQVGSASSWRWQPVE